MRLPAMITAITAKVGRRGRSRTAVCVQHGELPRPAPSGSYSTISEITGRGYPPRVDSATLGRRLAAIRYFHRAAGYDTPTGGREGCLSAWIDDRSGEHRSP
jgi:hypothetical protein